MTYVSAELVNLFTLKCRRETIVTNCITVIHTELTITKENADSNVSECLTCIYLIIVVENTFPSKSKHSLVDAYSRLDTDVDREVRPPLIEQICDSICT